MENSYQYIKASEAANGFIEKNQTDKDSLCYHDSRRATKGNFFYWFIYDVIDKIFDVCVDKLFDLI